MTAHAHGDSSAVPAPDAGQAGVRLFLCGDVMLGRGIDQILAHPGDARLYEQVVTCATAYVELAEQVHGAIPRRADPAYVWGDALAMLDDIRPDVRIVNLETSITTSRDFEPKGINYKMSPRNVECLMRAQIDCCVLANNHVLDWRTAGLIETLDTLARAGIASAGAGYNADAAAAPAVLRTAGAGRVLVFAFGVSTSGIPASWAAGPERPGVNLLEDLSGARLADIADEAQAVRRPGDLLVASIHWGGNWGYRVAAEERAFAHALVDVAGFHIVHGHSSHHPKAIEIHNGRPILYGCGDFLTDYEGIAGYEAFRGDLALMYLPAFSMPDGALVELRLVPLRMRKFRLNRASPDEASWLQATLARESARFGTRVRLDQHDALVVEVHGC